MERWRQKGRPEPHDDLHIVSIFEVFYWCDFGAILPALHEAFMSFL